MPGMARRQRTAGQSSRWGPPDRHARDPQGRATAYGRLDTSAGTAWTADLWPVLPVGAGTARRRRAESRLAKHRDGSRAGAVLVPGDGVPLPGRAPLKQLGAREPSRTMDGVPTAPPARAPRPQERPGGAAGAPASGRNRGSRSGAKPRIQAATRRAGRRNGRPAGLTSFSGPAGSRGLSGAGCCSAEQDSSRWRPVIPSTTRKEAYRENSSTTS